MRETACPTCNVPRTDLPLAELNPAADLLPALDGAQGHAEHGQYGGECCGAGAQPNCSTCEDSPADDKFQETGQPPGSPAAVMLICPTCDEAFSPRFYRWCENCGHDFGSGREDEPPEESDTNYRVVWAAVATVAVLIGLWIYLAWVFRS